MSENSNLRALCLRTEGGRTHAVEHMKESSATMIPCLRGEKDSGRHWMVVTIMRNKKRNFGNITIKYW